MTTFFVRQIPGFHFAIKIELYEDNERVGQISLMQIHFVEVPGSYDAVIPTGKMVNIVNPQVEPMHVRKGYCRMLTVKAIEMAKSLGFRFLSVENKFGAKKFFEGLGFEPGVFAGQTSNMRILSLRRYEHRENSDEFDFTDN
jgi:GNAT superfamily N-acetyltransferase